MIFPLLRQKLPPHTRHTKMIPAGGTIKRCTLSPRRQNLHGQTQTLACRVPLLEHTYSCILLYATTLAIARADYIAFADEHA